MPIIRSYPEDMTARAIYDMTNSPEITKLSDHYGETIELAGFAISEDVDANGEVQTKVAIRTVDGKLMATNSAPFLRDFTNILGCLDAVKKNQCPRRIRIDQRPTKSGSRKFSGCTWIE